MGLIILFGLVTIAKRTQGPLSQRALYAFTNQNKITNLNPYAI